MAKLNQNECIPSAIRCDRLSSCNLPWVVLKLNEINVEHISENPLSCGIMASDAAIEHISGRCRAGNTISCGVLFSYELCCNERLMRIAYMPWIFCIVGTPYLNNTLKKSSSNDKRGMLYDEQLI